MIRICTAFCLSALFLAAAANGAEFVDGVAAVVNGDIITFSELEERTAPHTASFEEGKEREEIVFSIRKRELELLIEEKLVVAEALARGFQAGEEEINAELERIRRALVTEERFARFLREHNLTEKLLAEGLRLRVLAGKLIDSEVRSKLEPPSEARMKEYYNKHSEKFIEPEKFRLSRITVAAEDSGGWTEAARTIEEIREKLLAGEDFDALARKHSPGAEENGDIGFVSRIGMAPELEDEILGLDIGGTTGIIRSGIGFHIVKLTGRREPGQLSFEEVSGELSGYLFHLEVEEAAQKWVDDLKAAADIRVFLK